jgi:hypothetical protein
MNKLIRWDLYTIKHAVSIYLGRVKEEETDWVSEVLVNVHTNQILEWGVEGVEEPNNAQLEEAWNLAKLEYYKQLQKSKVKDQFNQISETGGGGLSTSVKDTNGESIVVDCRRSAFNNDIQNLRGLNDLLQGGLISVVDFRDYKNEIHQLNAGEINTIYLEMLMWGMTTIGRKHLKDQLIDSCTTVEQVLSIDFFSEE